MEPTHEQLKQWVDGWKVAGVELEAFRREELLRQDEDKAIEGLSDVYDAALAQMPPRLTSGLVEQQAVLRKVRR